MAKFRVNWNLDLGKKKLYREGDVIIVPEEHVEALLKSGVITAADAESTDPQEPGKSDAGAQLAEIAAAQIARLTKDQLADLAKQQFGVELNPADLTKGAMLAAIAERAAAKPAD
jgi:hypothetical protein